MLLTKKRKTKRGKLYHEWKRKIKKRDNYTCQVCYKKHKSRFLASHHIYNWYDYPKKRYLLNNGITLCYKCHKSFHLRYGSRYNNPDQLQEFKRNHISLS